MASKSALMAGTLGAVLLLALASVPGSSAAWADTLLPAKEQLPEANRRMLTTSCPALVNGTVELNLVLGALKSKGYTTFHDLILLSPDVQNLLKDLLSNGKITILAPSNGALLNLGTTVLATLRTDRLKLAAFLKLHILVLRLPFLELKCLRTGYQLLSLNGVILVKGGLLGVNLNVLGSLPTISIAVSDLHSAASCIIHGLSSILPLVGIIL